MSTVETAQSLGTLNGIKLTKTHITLYKILNVSS